MSQGPLCPNLTQKVQKEVSQMANRNLSRVILLGGLSVNLNHLKIKGEGQLGVAEVDPHELDVRKTRHGKYQAQGTPTGLTWRQHLNKKQDRHSPSSHFVSSSTEAMDSDEAQRATAKIVQKLVEKQKDEEKTDQPLSIEDEQETLPTQTQIELKLSKEDKEKSEEVTGIEEEEVDLNDSEVTFTSAASKMSPKTRAALNDELDDTLRYDEENPGKRLPIEEPEEYDEDTIGAENTVIEKLTKIKPVPMMVYVSSEGTSKDDPIPKEGKTPKEKIDKSEGRKNDEKSKSEKKDGEKDITTKAILKESPFDYYLPIMGNPKLSEFPVIREELAPSEEAMGRVIEIPAWEPLFKTRYFGVDVKYGLIYLVKDKTWGPMVDKCNLFPLNQYEFKDVSPMLAGATSPREIDTLESKAEIPVAESTRKSKFQRVKIKNIGASFSDLENGNISGSTITSSSAETDKIRREIEAAEEAKLALEIERDNEEKERTKMIKKQQKYARERLRLARKCRTEIIEAIQEETCKLQEEKEATLQMKRKKRKSLKDKFIKYLKREEKGYEDYLNYIPAEGLDSDYLASISDLPQDHQIPNPEDELGLAKLMLKQVQLEDNLERGRKLYAIKAKESPDIIDLLNKDYREFRKEMEGKLEHVNSVLDAYVTREREKEIRDRDALLARQMQMEEEQRAQEEQRKAQLELEKVQKEQRKRLEEARRMHLEKEQRKELEEIQRLQQLEDRIKRARIKQEEFQRKLKEAKAEEDLRDKLWAEFQQKKEEMRLQEQNRENWLKQQEQNEQPLGRSEETIPPKYRNKRKEKQTAGSTPKGSYEEKNQKEPIRKSKVPQWQFDKDDLSREVYNKHMRKGDTGSLNIYCARCDRDHWGPCECVICGSVGHDENDCPQLEDEKSYLDQLQRQEEERLKRKRAEPCWLCKKVGHVCPDPKTEKKEKSKRPREIFCNFCEADGHLEQNCSIKKEIAEKPRLPEEYSDEQLEKEIEERVRKLRNIGNELNKREKNVTFKGKEEPKDDTNVGEAGKKAHQPKAGQGEKPPRRPNREEGYRQPPRRGKYATWRRWG